MNKNIKRYLYWLLPLIAILLLGASSYHPGANTIQNSLILEDSTGGTTGNTITFAEPDITSDYVVNYPDHPIQNEGSVRIDGDNGSPGFTQINLTENIETQIILSSPLNYELEAWSENITTPGDADVYSFTTDDFFENPIINQTHCWIITFDWARVGSSQNETIEVMLEDTVSGFMAVANASFLKGRTSGTATFFLVTIPNSSSIINGYEFSLLSSQDCDIDLISITRISTKKD